MIPIPPALVRYDWLPGPLGRMLVTHEQSHEGIDEGADEGADEGLITGLYFDGQRHMPRIEAHWVHDGSAPVIGRLRAQLEAYFEGRSSRFDLPLRLRGTLFQERVWRALAGIAPGDSLTYAELARRIDKPKAVRAVGAAVGRNPVSILVPCHRVLGRGGSLTGYAGGLERKAHLLRLEGIPIQGWAWAGSSAVPVDPVVSDSGVVSGAPAIPSVA